MPILPKPFPDEVVGSVVARACRHTGLSFKRLMSDVVGARVSNVSFLMTTSVRRFALLSGTEPDEFLMGHTMFPYAVAFMPGATRRLLQEKVLSAVPGKDSLSSLSKNISHGVESRRFCPECAKEEMARYGETYWHRSHLLPGALLCSQHGVKLSSTTVALKGEVNTRNMALPWGCREGATTVSMSVSIEKVRRVTEVSVAALHGNVVGADDWRQKQRADAIAQGFVLPSGDVASLALSVALGDFFGETYLDATGCPLSGGPMNYWPGLVARSGSNVNVAAAKNVLLQSFLELRREAVAPGGLCVEAGLGGGTSAVAGVAMPAELGAGAIASKAFASYSAPGPKTRDYGALDATAVQALKLLARQAERKGERTTVQALLREAGAWAAFKHQRSLMPLTAAFLRAFKASEQSARQVGGSAYWRRRLPGRFANRSTSGRDAGIRVP